jgi:hypothetical protein
MAVQAQHLLSQAHKSSTLAVVLAVLIPQLVD